MTTNQAATRQAVTRGDSDVLRVAHWVRSLEEAPVAPGLWPVADDSPSAQARLVEQIAELEQLKSAICAAQATLSVRFAEAHERAQQRMGEPAERAGRGVAEQIALARGESPHRGRVLLGAAKALVGEMPATLSALRLGRLNERRAIIAVRETACLTREHRAMVDAEIGTAARGEALGDRKLTALIAQRAYKLDAEAVVRKLEKAESERYVSIRPAADQMVWLAALLPLRAGVACYAALTKASDAAIAAGDGRNRSQLCADTLVERLTGRAVADVCDVELQVLISDAALLGASDEPAVVAGHGPVPVGWVRHLLDQTSDEQKVWMRQAFSAPNGLISMESKARRMPAGLKRLIVARDQHCRTPFCDAPIREADHVQAWSEGGPTDLRNAQGLCKACNMAREAPGWAARHDDEDGAITVTTPTGRRYRSRPPRPPTPERPASRGRGLYDRRPGKRRRLPG